ncbi:GNAT family N-acetyltransferase [Kiloniella laminariae]|uniref:GNAT family N-acetyltransferase n=1 Tax=Kiloniella laminariae TaxID=454162 RepID=A0ABT4LPV4_9PROT|nr:GNAT family N-acetyltransferase [Kiloniella laminariae]MCZ4282346.1 GNAT family N-acetyltransferase [Kiloniella laminariae]
MTISSQNFHKTSVPILYINEDVLLRPLKIEDIHQNYIDSLNHPHVRKYLAAHTGSQYTRKNVTQFVLENDEDRSAILFGFFVRGKHSGTCRLHDITQNCAWLGLAIFDISLWGQGWGNKIITTVSNYALLQLNIEQIRAAIDPLNIGSKSAFTKSGFHILPDEKLEREDGVLTDIWQRRGDPGYLWNSN